MTLLEINNSIQFVAQILGKSLEMSIEQFNLWLKLAQDEIFKEFASGYLSGNGAEVDSRTSAALAPFKENRTFSTYTTMQVFGVTGYRLAVNTEDYVYLSAFVSADTSDYPDKVKNIDIITGAEFGERLSNAITYPTDENPVLVMYGSSGTKYAFFTPKPSVLPNIQVISLRKPTTPSLVETITNGVRSQSSSSVALELDAIFHVDVIRKILGYLGISVGNEFILAAVENQKQKEQ